MIDIPLHRRSPDLEATGMGTIQKHIDAHVHVWTPDLANYPLTAGYERGNMQPPSFTPEQLFVHAKPAGVGRVVLIQMSYYGYDNRYMLDMIDQYPGIFAGVAVINDQTDRPQDEMRRLKNRGVVGFRLVTLGLDADNWFQSRGLRAMWKCGSEEQLAMSMLSDSDALPSIDRMCERFPETPVVVDHLARIGADGKIRERDIQQLCRLARHKQTFVKVSAFYALGKKQPPYRDLVPAIRQVFDAFGPQRLMWASDCPFQLEPGHSYQESVDLVTKHLDFATAEEKEWILTQTAERLFFSR